MAPLCGWRHASVCKGEFCSSFGTKVCNGHFLKLKVSTEQVWFITNEQNRAKKYLWGSGYEISSFGLDSGVPVAKGVITSVGVSSRWIWLLGHMTLHHSKRGQAAIRPQLPSKVQTKALYYRRLGASTANAGLKRIPGQPASYLDCLAHFPIVTVNI